MGVFENPTLAKGTIAVAKALAETPKNVGLVSTVALMLSDLTNLGRKSMEKEKVAAAAAKKDGTATTDGKVEIKDGLLYGVTSQTIVEHAKKALGTPYSTGQRAGGPGVGFDCSSFAYWAYEGYPGLMKNGWGSPEGVGWTGTLTGEGKPRDRALELSGVELRVAEHREHLLERRSLDGDGGGQIVCGGCA